MAEEFSIGERVIWESAGKEKQGEIIYIVQPGYYPPLMEFESGFSFRAFGYGSPRKKISYIVALDPRRKKIRPCYWPCAKLLKRI